MNDHTSFMDRFWIWLAGFVPRQLAYKVASRFWAYAWNYVSDEQADHYLEVLQAGYDHWRESGGEDEQA